MKPFKFFPENRRPDWGDLIKAAMFNPIVKACLAMYENNDITRDEALIGAILALVEVSWNNQEEFVQALLKERVIYVKEKQ